MNDTDDSNAQRLEASLTDKANMNGCKDICYAVPEVLQDQLRSNHKEYRVHSNSAKKIRLVATKLTILSHLPAAPFQPSHPID